MGLEGFDGVLFDGFYFRKPLAIVEVDEVGGSVVLASLSAFRAVPSEVSYFSALETCVGGVPCCGHVALEIALRVISLVSVGVLSSAEVVPSVVSSVVSLGWGPVPIYIHGNQGVVHPTRSIR